MGVELRLAALDGLVDEGKLVIRCVDDGRIAGVDAVTEGAPGMMHVEALGLDCAVEHGAIVW